MFIDNSVYQFNFSHAKTLMESTSCAVVPVNSLKSSDYDGMFFLYYGDKFISVDNDLRGDMDVEFDTFINDDFQLYNFVPGMLLDEVWKSNINNSTIIKYAFKSIIKFGHSVEQTNDKNRKNNYIWCIAEYVSENESVSVKFKKHYTKYYGDALTIETTGIHTTKKAAEFRLKNWAVEQLNNQNRNKNKHHTLKSTPVANNIVDRLPEIFV